MYSINLMQYIYNGHIIQYYFEGNHAENTNFSYYLAGHSCGIRKTDVRNIFLSLSNCMNAIYDCALRKCARALYVCATGKKCNGRTRRHCVREVDFHMKNIQNSLPYSTQHANICI